MAKKFPTEKIILGRQLSLTSIILILAIPTITMKKPSNSKMKGKEEKKVRLVISVIQMQGI